MNAAARLARLAPPLWAGVLLCIALIATPAPFATLAPADAGRVAGRILGQEAWISLAFAVALLLAERRHARAAAAAGAGSVFSTEIVLILGTMACTVVGWYVVEPLMVAARAGHGSLSFGQLHLISAACYGIKCLLVLALAWRVAGRG